jgi:large subunit ribosomal protein L23
MIDADKILIETVVTEKAVALTSDVNQYTFKVHPLANRLSIARAVEKTFGVKVTGVNVMNVKRKAKVDRARRGKLGYKGGMKKAIISLQEGDRIEII